VIDEVVQENGEMSISVVVVEPVVVDVEVVDGRLVVGEVDGLIVSTSRSDGSDVEIGGDGLLRVVSVTVDVVGLSSSDLVFS